LTGPLRTDTLLPITARPRIMDAQHRPATRDLWIAAGMFMLAMLVLEFFASALIFSALGWFRSVWWTTAAIALLMVPPSLWWSRRRAPLALVPVLALVLAYFLLSALATWPINYWIAREHVPDTGWGEIGARQLRGLTDPGFLGKRIGPVLLAAALWHYLLPGRRAPR
jgi:hypothetical protein